MPESIVVGCCSCSIHQVIQVNKKGKFVCKLCGTTQSVKTVLASGTAGRDLRNIVQELNMQLRKRDETRQEARRLASTCSSQFSGEQEVRDVETVQTCRWERFCVHSARSSAPGGEPEILADSMDFPTAFSDPIPHKRGLKRKAQGEATGLVAAAPGAWQRQQETEQSEEEDGGRDEEAVTAWWGRPAASPQQGNWVKFAGQGHNTEKKSNVMEAVCVEQVGGAAQGGGAAGGARGGAGAGAGAAAGSAAGGSQGRAGASGDVGGEGDGGGGGGGKDWKPRPLSFAAAWVPLDDECGVQSFSQRSSSADANFEGQRLAAACPTFQIETGELETQIGRSAAVVEGVETVALGETTSASSAGKWARFVQS